MDQPQKPSQTAAAAAGAAAYQTPAPEEASGKSTKGSFFLFLKFQFGNFRLYYFTLVSMCGKHISNVVALYLKCLRAFFGYL